MIITIAHKPPRSQRWILPNYVIRISMEYFYMEKQAIFLLAITHKP